MSNAVRLAEPADAPELLRVIRAAFSARPPVDPPAEALADQIHDVEAAIERGYGVIVERDGRAIAGLLMEVEDGTATLRRVSVLPEAGGAGVGFDMIATTLIAAADLGARRVEIVARSEFPQTIAWWERAGFVKLRPLPTGWVMGRSLPVPVRVPDAASMRALGRRLAEILRAGDVIVATGELGAGKTTLTQGIGEGLGVQGPIISPTFVLARIHRNAGDGPDLVHVDAYRLGSAGELGDIDLQETQPRAVTLIEWGRGLAEWLSPDRLDIDIQRSDDPADEERTVYLFGVGERWRDTLEQFREDA